MKTKQFSNELLQGNNKKTEKENYQHKVREYEENNQGEKNLSVPYKRHMERRNICQRQLSMRTEKSDNKLDYDTWGIPR